MIGLKGNSTAPRTVGEVTLTPASDEQGQTPAGNEQAEPLKKHFIKADICIKFFAVQIRKYHAPAHRKLTHLPRIGKSKSS